MQALVTKPTGTGPFKFVQWARDERLVLEKNPDYWKGAADLNRVTFRYIPEFSARLAALLAGEIDIMKDVPPHAVEMVDKSGKAQGSAPPCRHGSTTWPSSTSSRADAGPPGPRKAINHAVERGRADPAGAEGPGEQDVRVAVAAQRRLRRRHRVLQARSRAATALFKEAGVDPTKLQLTLDSPSGRYPLDKDVSLAIAAQLQRAGHQGQRGGERVGHAPGQDQEPDDRRHVLPRLGAGARGPGHHRAALPGRARRTPRTAATRPSRTRSRRR